MNFCLPERCRIFSKHWGVGYEAATSTLVLGYYYFLVFLAFVAPKTESTTTTKANGLFLSECVVSLFIYTTHLILKSILLEKERAIHCVFAILDYFFSFFSFPLISKLLSFFPPNLFNFPSPTFFFFCASCFVSTLTSIIARRV